MYIIHNPSNFHKILFQNNLQYFFVLLIFFIAVQPTVEITPSSPTFRQGRGGSIKCTGSGYPVPEITWFRGGRRIASVISQNGTRLTANLIFTRVSDAK